MFQNQTCIFSSLFLALTSPEEEISIVSCASSVESSLEHSGLTASFGHSKTSLRVSNEGGKIESGSSMDLYLGRPNLGDQISPWFLFGTESSTYEALWLLTISCENPAKQET